jgi:crossover junction endodeoxyribonuclease RuvC
MKVVGLDLSLTCTGVAVATQDGAITDRITSSPARTVRKGDPPLTLQERAERLRRICHQIRGHITYADLVIIEGPSYGSDTPYMHDRSGLWWLVVADLRNLGYTVVEVAPKCRIRYALGKGAGSKDDVLSAVIRRYPHVDVNGNDEADALILAAMGARFLRHPLERPVPGRPLFPGSPLPKTCLAAMDAVTWPNPDRVSA